MTPVQHPLGEHLATCSSPEDCAEYAAVLAMTPTQHANYLNDSTARFAQKRTASQFRVSQQEDYTPPDSYAPALAAKHAAEATPRTRAEDRYREERRAEFEADYAEHDEWCAAHPAPRLRTAEELKEYEAPDAYGPALAALKENRR